MLRSTTTLLALALCVSACASRPSSSPPSEAPSAIPEGPMAGPAAASGGREDRQRARSERTLRQGPVGALTVETPPEAPERGR